MKTLTSNHWALFYLAVLVAGAGWIWISRAPPGSTTDGDIPAPQEGFLAPDFSLETSTGETIRLSELRGHPVLLNVWASWCAPCRAEMPALERTYQDHASQGFLILGVNATSQDDPSRAVAFTEALGLTFPILFDYQGQVYRLYQVRALPTSFFIDAQGTIQEVVVGGPMSEALLQIRVQQLFEAAPLEVR